MVQRQWFYKHGKVTNQKGPQGRHFGNAQIHAKSSVERQTSIVADGDSAFEPDLVLGRKETSNHWNTWS